MIKRLREMIDAARLVYPDNEILQILVVTQAVHESGLHIKPDGSQLASKYNNFFGIKKLKSKPDDYVMMPTWEMINGRTVQVQAPFATFKSVEECFKQHRTMMNWPRYRLVLEAETVDEVFIDIYKAGWATDVRYPNKLKAVYEQFVKSFWPK